MAQSANGVSTLSQATHNEVLGMEEKTADMQTSIQRLQIHADREPL